MLKAGLIFLYALVIAKGISVLFGATVSFWWGWCVAGLMGGFLIAKVPD